MSRKETTTTGTESFDDVVMPPSDDRQLRALDHLLHETTSPTLCGADGEETILPVEVYNVLVEVVAAMNKGMAVVLAPKNQRLTTREAADYLGISRPTLVRLLEDGKIPYDQPSRHRYVYLSDLAEYKQTRRHERRDTLAEMTKTAASAGLYDTPETEEEIAATSKKVRQALADSAKP
jgi:excisionase family DNA binding protein